MPTEFQFDHNETLATTLAKCIAEDLRAALTSRHQASLVVSGGRTPAPFLAALNKHVLDWSSVWITLSDERWVDIKHSESNEAMARQCLLQNHAASAHFVGLKNAAPAPFEGENACEKAVATLPRPFDVVLLGMGDDGHIASLFPQAPQLKSALDVHSGRLCISIDPMTAPHLRMSLTLPALLASRKIVLMFTGARKYEVYLRALQAGPIEALPVRSILHQHRVPVDVYWSH